MNAYREKPKITALTAALWMAVAGLALVGYALFAAMSKPEPSGYRGLAKGAMAKLILSNKAPTQPNLSFFGPEGKAMTLADFKGRVVLVNFWATWCAPCIEEMPGLAALQEMQGGPQFEVIAINVDIREPGISEAREELQKLSGGQLRFFADPTMNLAYEARAQGMPTTILYAADQREIARYIGKADWASPDARALVRAAIAEGQQQTPAIPAGR